MWLARNVLGTMQQMEFVSPPFTKCLVRLQAQQLTGISKTRGILVNQNASGSGYYQVQDATGALIIDNRGGTLYYLCSNRAYPRMEQLFRRRFALITALKVLSSSSIRRL